MRSGTSEGRARRWLRLYARSTFLSVDFGFGVATLVASGVLLALGETVRRQVDPVLAGSLGVSAGLLGVILAAMAIVTAFITQSFIAAVGDLEEELMPFRTTAVVAGVGAFTSLAGLLLPGRPWEVITLVSAVALGTTVWAVVGVIQLVGLIVFFARKRAQVELTLLQAEELRRRRLTGRSATPPA